MGLLSKMLRRGDKIPAGPTFKETLTMATVQGDVMRGDGETEVAWKQNLAFKYEAIHDEDVEEILAQKCLVPQLIPKLKEDGSIDLQTNEKGELLVDGNGHCMPKFVQAYAVDNTFAAIRTMVSHVNRLVFLQPKNAKLISLYMEDIIETAKMSMNESSFDLGAGSYLDSLWSYVFMLINDAENGNKVKSMFEISKRQRIEFGPEQKEKKGLF
jgi:hypothetical protein